MALLGLLLGVLCLAALTASSSAASQPWPVACPRPEAGGAVESAAAGGAAEWTVAPLGRRLLSLSSVNEWMLPAHDLFLDVSHDWVVLTGSIFDKTKHTLAVYSFWCVFSTGEISTSSRDSVDDAYRSFTRTCRVPLAAKEIIDEGGEVSVRFVPPFRNEVIASEWHLLSPHPFRCSPAKRAELQVPAAVPLFAASSMTTAAGPQPSSAPLYNLIVSVDLTSFKAGTELPFLHMVEWIEYHALQGVDHFFIYYDPAEIVPETSAIFKVFSYYAQQDLVTTIPWPTYSALEISIATADSKFSAIETLEIPHHCNTRFGRLAAWYTVLQYNEFILPLEGHKDITAFLIAAKSKMHPGTVGLKAKKQSQSAAGGKTVEPTQSRIDAYVQLGSASTTETSFIQTSRLHFVSKDGNINTPKDSTGDTNQIKFIVLDTAAQTNAQPALPASGASLTEAAKSVKLAENVKASLSRIS